MRRLRLSLLCAATAAAATVLMPAVAAHATVSAAPASWTPAVTSTDATVRKLLQCGSTMYAVGTFTSISQGGHNYVRNNAFSFDATTGAVSAWNPNVTGGVESIAFSADCATAYLGGKFTAVGGVAARNLAAVSTSTGAIVTGFGHSVNGVVHTLATVAGGTQVVIGGAFTTVNGAARSLLASVDPTTGAATPYAQLSVGGQVTNGATPMVYNSQVSARGDRLLLEGSFTTVNGAPRRELAELDLGPTSATLDPFYSSSLNNTSCPIAFFVRGANFSPDGNTVYIGTTGGISFNQLCDAAAAFPNTANASTRWVNRTGGDSLYAVAAGPADVYVAGHERWANNPFGADSCSFFCVSRPGIGDISASSGQATSWNPTRDRGQGADDLLITPAGLWVASDTFYNSVKCAGQYHPGICFFPGTA